jgi:hypothetical protein
MAVADRAGLPLAVGTASASPHQSRLVASTLDSRCIAELTQRLIGDRAYDAYPLDKELARLGVEMIARIGATGNDRRRRMVVHCVGTSAI